MVVVQTISRMKRKGQKTCLEMIVNNLKICNLTGEIVLNRVEWRKIHVAITLDKSSSLWWWYVMVMMKVVTRVNNSENQNFKEEFLKFIVLCVFYLVNSRRTSNINLNKKMNQQSSKPPTLAILDGHEHRIIELTNHCLDIRFIISVNFKYEWNFKLAAMRGLSCFLRIIIYWILAICSDLYKKINAIHGNTLDGIPILVIIR